MAEPRPCLFRGGKACTYTVYRYGRDVWKIMCGARVDCCTLLNDFDTQDEAVAAWNRRSITPSELTSALASWERQKGASNASNTKEFLGNPEPCLGADRAVDNLPSAGLPDIAGTGAAAGLAGDTRDDERGQGQTA